MKKNSGQAMIVLLFVVAIAVTLLIQTTVRSLASVGLGNEYFEGALLLSKAEGYLENAALRHLRDPNYTGENVTEGNFSCTLEVVDIAGGKDLTASCQKGPRSRKVGMTVSFTSGLFVFSKIEERE